MEKEVPEEAVATNLVDAGMPVTTTIPPETSTEVVEKSPE